MRKKVHLILIFSLIVLNTFSQQTNIKKDINYEVTKYISNDKLNKEVKEFLVKQIRKTNLVKNSDNHDLVHFFLDRYENSIKQMIISRFENQKSITP